VSASPEKVNNVEAKADEKSSEGEKAADENQAPSEDVPAKTVPNDVSAPEPVPVSQ